jgi:hypothetical protein
MHPSSSCRYLCGSWNSPPTATAPRRREQQHSRERPAPSAISDTGSYHQDIIGPDTNPPIDNVQRDAHLQPGNDAQLMAQSQQVQDSGPAQQICRAPGDPYIWHNGHNPPSDELPIHQGYCIEPTKTMYIHDSSAQALPRSETFVPQTSQITFCNTATNVLFSGTYQNNGLAGSTGVGYEHTSDVRPSDDISLELSPHNSTSAGFQTLSEEDYNRIYMSTILSKPNDHIQELQRQMTLLPRELLESKASHASTTSDMDIDPVQDSYGEARPWQDPQTQAIGFDPSQQTDQVGDRVYGGEGTVAKHPSIFVQASTPAPDYSRTGDSCMTPASL